MSTPLTARRALERYCDAFARRAADEIEPLFADDAVYDLPLQDGRIHGRDHIMREIRTALRGLKSIEVHLEHVLESGDSASCEGVFRSEHIGIPPHVDGRPARLDFRFVAVVEVSDGKIVRLSEYFDTKPLKPLERMRIYP